MRTVIRFLAPGPLAPHSSALDFSMRSLSALVLVSLAACTPLGPDGTPREARPFEAADLDPTKLRFATYNINTVGFPGDTEYAALQDVIGRLQPDVLALNEIEDDDDAFETEDLAAAMGYDYVVIADHIGFGDDRNAILSRYPISAAGIALSDDPGEGHFRGWNSPSLSGDSDALDISRAIVGATVHTPVGDIGMVSLHWKSGGSDNRTEFRRAVEVYRTLQALDAFEDVDHLLVSGDLNVDVFDRDPTPTTFTAEPTGFPARWSLGDDMVAQLSSEEGLVNHPHALLDGYGLVRHPAAQADGSEGTRPSSGRTLDYVYTDAGMVRTGSEIFNSLFDDRITGLDKGGDPLDALACAETSDHLPVIVDFDLGSDVTLPPDVLGFDDLVVGDVLVTEMLPDPDDCSDSTGEFVEIRNVSGFTADLTGLVVADASGNEGTLDTLVLEDGEIAVLGRSASPCGFSADGSYGDRVTLNNSGDDVYLLANGVEIDHASYDSTEAGLSWSRDDEDAWCIGDTTAGMANPVCGEPSGEEPEPDPDPEPEPSVLTITDLGTGDLALTELMVNPDACSDSTGEWVEITNLAGNDVELAGLVLEDASGNGSTLGAFVLAAGERAVVARSATACGVDVDLTFSSVTLNNTSDTVTLFAGTTVVDTVAYDASAGVAGASWAVDGAGVWCSGLPTAGGPNPTCP